MTKGILYYFLMTYGRIMQCESHAERSPKDLFALLSHCIMQPPAQMMTKVLAFNGC